MDTTGEDKISSSPGGGENGSSNSTPKKTPMTVKDVVRALQYPWHKKLAPYDIQETLDKMSDSKKHWREMYAYIKKEMGQFFFWHIGKNLIFYRGDQGDLVTANMKEFHYMLRHYRVKLGKAYKSLGTIFLPTPKNTSNPDIDINSSDLEGNLTDKGGDDSSDGSTSSESEEDEGKSKEDAIMLDQPITSQSGVPPKKRKRSSQGEAYSKKELQSVQHHSDPHPPTSDIVTPLRKKKSSSGQPPKKKKRVRITEDTKVSHQSKKHSGGGKQSVKKITLDKEGIIVEILISRIGDK